MIYNQAKLARRYARAFLNVFEDSFTPQAMEALIALVIFLKKHAHACFLMELSFLSVDAKKEAVRDLCLRFKVTEGVQRLFLLLIDHQRTSLAPDVFDAVIDLYKRKENYVYFSVSTTCELSDQQKKMIEEFLQDQVKGMVFCSYAIDKTLIAGIRMQSDNWLWENSVKSRLRTLQQTLQF